MFFEWKVTVRGATHAFLCYPVGDDKLLVLYIDVAFDEPLRADGFDADSRAASVVDSDADAVTSSTSSSSATSLVVAAPAVVDPMERIVSELSTLL